MKTIDGRGHECPMPVIMAKRLIKAGEAEFLVQVDNKVATENLSKLAKQTGYNVNINKLDEDSYEVIFNKSEDINPKNSGKDDYILVFDSNKIGNGDEEFSKKLLEAFLLAQTEQDTYPKYVICYNSGVELTTTRENTVEDFKKLESKGVEILSCGLCLDNYSLKEKLQVGEITNMYRICELMTTYRVVRP